MCHVNLDMKQAAIEKRFGVHYNLPIYYRRPGRPWRWA